VTAAEQAQPYVAVVGAGPAGLYAAKQLADNGVRVALFNRDIKPGGLAEYGIYHDKHKMKEGLRKQFRQILEMPAIDYYGNVTVGQEGDLTLDDLRALGFQAILVTVGAQGTKWLGLPGEDLAGVYHAKDLVYHYNRLPPYSQQQFHIGRRAALIGVGNVMIDIAHWMVHDLKIDEVVAVARRGPAEVKFTKKEMESVAANLDVEALDAELARVEPIMESVGQSPETAREFILSAQKNALPKDSDTRFYFDFLASPSRILGDANGRVSGLEVEDTTLLPSNGDTKARGLGTFRELDVDTVVFCIGDRVDEALGLPVQWNEFVKSPNPRFPADNTSYEAFDPEAGQVIPDVFVAGWARKASEGLVGVARKDGTQGAQAVLQYLGSRPLSPATESLVRQTRERLAQLHHPVVTKTDWQHLEAAERAEAERLGLESFKYDSNDEMLLVMQRATSEPVA
jgi:ferredoxin--NADP+ reductase